MGLSLHGYQVLVYCLAGFILGSMTLYALVLGWFFRNKNKTTENFITARGQVPMWRVAWSFYAGAVGAWVITGPATYSPWAGVIGMVFYAVASGLPVLMIAYAGDVIQKRLPHVLSLTDYIGWRFGFLAKTYVVILCCFNMGIALLAEYTTIGALFGVYLGSARYPIIIVVGALTTIYTVYGGLVVSIYTDQIQGITSIVFFLVIAIYMAVKFRPDLPHPIPCNPDDLDANPMGFCISGTDETGYSSIFAMPASLFTATVFSEAMWQRAWASSSKRNLRVGAWIGCAGIILVVFFAGLCGLLAAWGGLITADTDMNLYMIQPLTGAVNADGNVSNWLGVLVILLAVTMNMSAVDSLQNGLAGAISSHLLKDVPHSLVFTRIAVILVNVPLVVLGTKGYTILQLFLLANMLCSTSAVPVLLGLVESLHPYLGGVAMLSSCLLSFFLTSVFGVKYFYGCDATCLAEKFAYYEDAPKNVAKGMEFTWTKNNYNWRFFLVSLGVSTGSMILFAVASWLWQRGGHRKPAVLGFVAPATHPDIAHYTPPRRSSMDESDDSDKHASDKTEGGQFMTDPPPFNHQPVAAA